MILSKFIDKTFKAAKESALQIYGDDYSNLKDVVPGKEEDDGNNASDKRKKKQSKSENKKRPVTQKATRGVVFERSAGAKPDNKDSSNKKLEKKLESIRKYAAQQTKENTRESFNKADATTDAKPAITTNKKNSTSEQQSINDVYSRKDIRNRTSAVKRRNSQKETPKQEFETVTLNNMEPPSESDLLYDKFVEELPNGVSPVAHSKEEQTDAKNSDDDAIHKRLDRLESLIHLALSTPDTAYSEHPLFHKLLHKGVSQKLIRGWFEHIIEQGIQPAQQPQLFYSKLLQHIDELLQQSKAGNPKRIMLFAGRSGSGKTHLIMKLASLPLFAANKQIAIASFAPTNGSTKNRYSILAPFCNDQGIDFYHIESTEQVKAVAPKWKNYDHVLIDTPSLEMEGQSLIEDIASLKNEFYNKMGIETHYLVNTAVNGTAFNDPLAKDIEADHIALSHIDQSLKWGKTVQLLANTDYKLRYISSGPSIMSDLLPFKPEKFARKLLRA
ncbi:hypothetical protein CK503_07380 [Aliifodinibius salipaludis]|uniref:SRP54-type proteins GTP-binding domain-containing protein n=1 Tax=Fodinibius salipaludis TaxID=2032627 RepID=A0A2A2GCJ5_9BACT|nr:hypothetical protein [Aliifodinibius salipaludis]PAU94607.1 hypothetical protein CK503_07380 [Aliifodinibius salipaludis]